MSNLCKVQNGLATLGDEYFLINDSSLGIDDYVYPIVKGSKYKGGEITQRIVFAYKKDSNRFKGITEEDNLLIVEYKDFAAEHIVEITESELENANYHELVSVPRKFLKRLVKLDKFNEKDLRLIIQNFAETILEFV